jgi:hypothetical protein
VAAAVADGLRAAGKSVWIDREKIPYASDWQAGARRHRRLQGRRAPPEPELAEFGGVPLRARPRRQVPEAARAGDPGRGVASRAAGRWAARRRLDPDGPREPWRRGAHDSPTAIKGRRRAAGPDVATFPPPRNIVPEDRSLVGPAAAPDQQPGLPNRDSLRGPPLRSVGRRGARRTVRPTACRASRRRPPRAARPSAASRCRPGCGQRRHAREGCRRTCPWHGGTRRFRP